MKTLIFFFLFFSLLALPTLAELTDADFDKIRLIVNDSVNESEKRVKQDIKAEIDRTEKNIKEYIDLKIDSVEKRLSTYNWVIYVLMPLIVAAIGIPTSTLICSHKGFAKEKVTMPYTNYTSIEVASCGEAIYRRKIRDKVEPNHKGKFLVIDIETGEYEINADDLVATKHLLAKQPNAVVYGLRIGFPTAYRIGRRFSLKTQ